MKRLLTIVFLAFAALLLTAWPLLTAWGKDRVPLEGELTLIALRAPPPWVPARQAESQGDRYERLNTIARAIALEAAHPPPEWRWGPRELAALLLATTYEEGWRWRRDVHDGTLTGDHGRARCLAQLHRHPTWMPKELWLASTGTDLRSTRICVAGAARVLAHYASECVSEWRAEHDIEGSFSRVVAGYGTGQGCTPRKWSNDRARRAATWLLELKEKRR